MANAEIGKVMNGKGGAAWFNGKKLATLQSVEAKVTGDFEDVNVCDDPATYSLYNGWKGEGSLTYLKVDSDVVKLLSEAYKSGVMPEITLVTRLQSPGSSASERVSYSGVTVTEFMLAKFEKKTNVEEEIPFKFADYELLETV